MPGGNEPVVVARLPGAKPIAVKVVVSPESVAVSASAELRTSGPPTTLAAVPSRPPVARAGAVLILAATGAAVSVDTIVPTETATPPFRPAAWMVIAAGAP